MLKCYLSQLALVGSVLLNCPSPVLKCERGCLVSMTDDPIFCLALAPAECLTETDGRQIILTVALGLYCDGFMH
jgi:hypothetical protein